MTSRNKTLDHAHMHLKKCYVLLKTLPKVHMHTKTCYVLIKNLSESELQILQNKTLNKRGRQDAPFSLKKSSIQIALGNEAQKNISKHKTKGKLPISKVTRQSRQNKESRKTCKTSNLTKDRKVEIVLTKSHQKCQVPTDTDRNSIPKNKINDDFIKEEGELPEKEIIQLKQVPLEKCIVYSKDIYVTIFINYLYWLREQIEENGTIEFSESGIEEELRLDNENYEPYVNKKLVELIIKLSLKIDVYLEDQWQKIENAIIDAENHIMRECRIPRKRKRKAKRGKFSYLNQLKKCKLSSPNDFAEDSINTNHSNNSTNENSIFADDSTVEDKLSEQSTHENSIFADDSTVEDKLSEQLNNTKETADPMITTISSHYNSEEAPINDSTKIDEISSPADISTHLLNSPTLYNATDNDKFYEFSSNKQENGISLTESKNPTSELPFPSFNIASLNDCADHTEDTFVDISEVFFNSQTLGNSADGDKLFELISDEKELFSLWNDNSPSKFRKIPI